MIDPTPDVFLSTLRCLYEALRTSDLPREMERLLERLSSPRIGDLVVNTSLKEWWSDYTHAVGVAVEVGPEVISVELNSGDAATWQIALVQVVPSPDVFAELDCS